MAVSKVSRSVGTITLTDDVLTQFDEELWRVYASAGAHPALWNQMREFGPLSEMRFDPHRFGAPRLQPGIGVYYAATEAVTALAESYSREKVIDRGTKSPVMTRWAPTRPLTLVDLTSTAITQISVAAVQMTGTVTRSRAFARALYKQHGADIDGIRSRSSVNNGINVILFSRGMSAFPSLPALDSPLASAYGTRLVVQSAKHLGWGVL